MANEKKKVFLTEAARKDPYSLIKNRPEYQLFQSEYYSAADVKIFLGDIWVEDAIMISYSMDEKILPIFGYASYTYDAVARGQRIVNGSLDINFKNSGYLLEVLENAEAIDYAIAKGKKESNIRPEFFENTKLDTVLKVLGKKSFEQIADEYEKALWGEGNENLLGKDYESYFPTDEYGFDLKIYYGPVEAANKYGDKKTYKKHQLKRAPLSVEVINGVQFMGQSKQIATANESMPILESYSFIARDINGTSLSGYKLQ